MKSHRARNRGARGWGPLRRDAPKWSVWESNPVSLMHRLFAVHQVISLALHSLHSFARALSGGHQLQVAILCWCTPLWRPSLRSVSGDRNHRADPYRLPPENARAKAVRWYLSPSGLPSPSPELSEDNSCRLSVKPMTTSVRSP